MLFLDGFCGEKRGELMVFCGDLGGRFSASKKCHLLKIFLKIFLLIFWRPFGGANRGGNRGSGDRSASTTAFLQKMPLALLGVSQLGNLLVVAIGCEEYKILSLEHQRQVYVSGFYGGRTA